MRKLIVFIAVGVLSSLAAYVGLPKDALPMIFLIAGVAVIPLGLLFLLVMEIRNRLSYRKLARLDQERRQRQQG